MQHKFTINSMEVVKVVGNGKGKGCYIKLMLGLSVKNTSGFEH